MRGVVNRDSSAPSPSAAGPAAAEGELVRVEEVTKAYPGVIANDRVSLALQRGQIHAVIGENGAGKSTLMGMLYGLYRPDRGRILVAGEEVEFASPRDALAAGIAFVQQTFSLIPTLTVAENLVLASEGAGQPITLKQSREAAVELAERYGLQVRPGARAEELSVGERQQAELIKALAFAPRVLLLDEPTSVLTPQQTQQLSRVMRQLASEGIGIFLITHKLEAVLADANHVSVLRRGRLVGSMPAAEASRDSLASLMIGELAQRPAAQAGPVVAERAPVRSDVLMAVEDLWVPSPSGEGHCLEGVTLDVHAGEIVGIAGVEGSGQVELTETLTGVRAAERGTIRVGDRDLGRGGVRDFQAAGVGHIPADRKGDAVVESMSVADNLVMPVADRPPFSRFGVISKAAVRRHAVELIETYDIRVPGPDTLVGALSGGNQQKVVVARECSRDPQVTVACYPTQGLDFSAMEFVWSQLRQRRAQGAAVVVASSDLDELLDLADRIVVLHAGRIAGEVRAEDATAEQLGLMMGGAEAR
jgi:simple sugar transport system ATP-binding protein